MSGQSFTAPEIQQLHAVPGVGLVKTGSDAVNERLELSDNVGTYVSSTSQQDQLTTAAAAAVPACYTGEVQLTVDILHSFAYRICADCQCC